MKKMTSSEIRRTWLDFFASKGHHVEKGASLIPHNDPTLLWINAGVAALKKYFDGSEIPPCKRITNAQKCIRTNDIDNVGHTARHHTFFEMMGNFSIGDYFRNEVIPWAVELLTDEKYFNFPKEKLYITHHPNDLATKSLWMANGIEESHLIPLEGNFWEIGEGPCGPDTEIFFDRGEKYDPNGIGIDLLKNDMENDRYVEIWNIVFSQFNSEPGKPRNEYKELPSKNIDTGAGLERFACIIQETDSNFETDLFWPSIEYVSQLTGKKYEDNKLAFRVIADHIRAITFATSDGEMFSNEGRGYVLRRLLRRAERYGRVLGINKPFLFELVDIVANNMKDYYPYLLEKKDFVAKLVKAEEEKFLKTLDNGEAMLKKAIETNGSLSGEDMFKLYDTYGFPKELTIEICEEKGVKVDLDTFEKLMKEQKERARAARSDAQSMNKQSKDLMEFADKSDFIYDGLPLKATVIGVFKDGVKVDELDSDGDVIFDKTNFYAEMGGQVADTGEINNDTCNARVTMVNKAPNKQHLHHVAVNFGAIKVGDSFTLSINAQRRDKIARNHSSVHLLQEALVEVLGNHIAQQGSYVNDEYSHFDFNHFEKITQEQLAEIERKVNSWICESIKEDTKVLPIEEAKKIGATALFDEKYGDVVRVVCFGDISKEFCGGTHVKNTSDIGLFVIESEESVAAGIRRIQARTSYGAYELLKNRETLLARTRDQLNLTSYTDVNSKVSSLLNENSELKKQNSVLLDKISAFSAKNLSNDIKNISGFEVLFKFVNGASRSSLMSIIDNLKSNKENYIFALVGEENNSYPIVVSCSKSLINKGINAGLVVKQIAQLLGGSGGGRPDLASGAGRNIDKLSEAQNLVEGLIK